jgi:hypothetical protein
LPGEGEFGRGSAADVSVDQAGLALAVGNEHALAGANREVTHAAAEAGELAAGLYREHGDASPKGMH